jgi:hypothetical protein
VAAVLEEQHRLAPRSDPARRYGDHAYGDAAPLLPQIARQLGLPDSFVTHSVIGSIDPAKTVPAEEAYLAAFFDRWLGSRDNHLLDSPSPRYPEFTFVR